MRDILTEIWSTARRNKLRTALTGFAVAWGIFMLIFLLGCGNGLINAQMHNMNRFLDNSMMIGGGRTSKGYEGLPEGRRIFTQMTVEENLEMGAYSQPNSTIKASLDEVYELFPRLKERRTQIGGTLSGGEQQMLAMGRSLMAKPRLIMLDEPSMGLAPILVDHIFDIIKSLHRNGATILLVEQNAQAALSVADRAYVLETGKVVMSGTGRELLASDQIKKAYLGA